MRKLTQNKKGSMVMYKDFKDAVIALTRKGASIAYYPIGKSVCGCLSAVPNGDILAILLQSSNISDFPLLPSAQIRVVSYYNRKTQKFACPVNCIMDELTDAGFSVCHMTQLEESVGKAICQRVLADWEKIRKECEETLDPDFVTSVQKCPVERIKEESEEIFFFSKTEDDEFYKSTLLLYDRVLHTIKRPDFLSALLNEDVDEMCRLFFKHVDKKTFYWYATESNAILTEIKNLRADKENPIHRRKEIFQAIVADGTRTKVLATLTTPSSKDIDIFIPVDSFYPNEIFKGRLNSYDYDKLYESILSDKELHNLYDYITKIKYRGKVIWKK